MPTIDAYSKLIIQAKGSNNSTTFTDLSLNPKTITPSGDAKITTSVYKFPPSCASFDGSSDYLLVDDSSDFNVGSGDFTIHFWFYPTAETRMGLFAWDADLRLGIDYHWYGTRNINIWASSTGSSWNMINADGGGNGIGSVSLTLNAWNHIAVVRNGDNWRTYINGTKDIDINVSGTVIYRNEHLVIGTWGSGIPYYLQGYLAEYVFDVGIARWTSDFTPPTSEYTVASTVNDNLDILINLTDVINLSEENNLDILINLTDVVNLPEENNLDITCELGYNPNDYQYCGNLDIICDLVPVGYFDSNYVTIDENGDVVIDPVTQEPLIEEPSDDEFYSYMGIRAFFQLPDSGEAYEIPPEYIIGANIQDGINQPILWSLQILNKDRIFSDPDEDYDQLIGENLYIPDKNSRRFIAIVLMSYCGTKVKTLIFPRLVIKEISGTEVISLSGIDEISEYLSRRVTLNPYCCTEALSKVIPEDQELIAEELAVTNVYTVSALTNAFEKNKINNESTQLLLNYNVDLAYGFDESSTYFTIVKPTPEPPIFGVKPGVTPVYQIEQPGINMIAGRDYIAVASIDSLGNQIKGADNNPIYLYFIVDPRLPVIAISPLSMHWTIQDMCKKVIDLQDGDIRKEYFVVKQHYQDFKYYSDINVLNTDIGSTIKQQCLDAIPAEYYISCDRDGLNASHSVYTSGWPSFQINMADYDGYTFYSTMNLYTYNNAVAEGTTTEVQTTSISGMSLNSSNVMVNWTISTELTISRINTHITDSVKLPATIVNSWKLELNIYDIVLESEKPAPQWYIPEKLIRTEEHQISRTGVQKFNTVKVVSPMELGTAQVYPAIIQVPPTANQYTRPIFQKTTNLFLGLSSVQPITISPNSWFYIATNLPVAYPVKLTSAGGQYIDMGMQNQFTITPTRNSPSTVNVYNADDSFYQLTLLWNIPCYI